MAKKHKPKSSKREPSPHIASGKGEARVDEASPIEQPFSSPAEKAGPRVKVPIVGIGASAGGLEALQKFFAATPADLGLAFVVVVHLHPKKESLLPSLLQGRTKMSVLQATDGKVVRQNCVYVIPTNKTITVLDGRLRLADLASKRTFPIDHFFRSLAAEQGPQAIGIILSGGGTDGTLGIRALKEQRGMVIVQDTESAQHDGMPGSAIATGLPDHVLPPEEMPSRLVRFDCDTVQPVEVPVEENANDEESLKAIFAVLLAQTGNDFSGYKEKTIRRRIERRMSIHQLSNITDYVKHLRRSAREPEILFKELMIGVTSFFRDPLAFEFLQTQVFPRLISETPTDSPIRVWVAGCSTGEEAYSLAIALHESMESAGCCLPVQIFATDIDKEAIGIARRGEYGEDIQAAVGNERINRYFDLNDGRYRIKPMIREMLIFAPQNIISDPPFTKLDLLSCRNLLIYLDADVQQRLLPIFHYSLNPAGTLFLGSSESIGPATDLFSLIDKKWKIFARRGNPLGLRTSVDFPLGGVKHSEKTHATRPKKDDMNELQLVETILEESGASPCVIIDDDYNVLYIHGRTGRFLEPPEGKASVNLLAMARIELRTELATAVRQVATTKQHVVIRGLRVPQPTGDCLLNVTVKPILNPIDLSGMLLVVFDEVKSSTTPKTVAASPATGISPSVEELQSELQQTKEHLQATIEELETSNEEHKSTNEELQSTNEELQSTNEELETSKEELQSLNEESATVNAELQARVDELSKSNDDIKNLLDSTAIATLFLDLQLNITRFTPVTRKMIPLTPTDIGRPIGDLTTTLIDVDLTNIATCVLEDLMMRETELNSSDGSVFLLRARPYRTIANVIDGVVLTFEDVTERKRAEDAMRDSEKRFRTLFELANDSIVLVDVENHAFVESNERAAERLGYSQKQFSQLTVADVEALESTEETERRIAAIVKKGREVFVTKHRRKNGDVIDVQVKAKHIVIKGRDYLLCYWFVLPNTAGA